MFRERSSGPASCPITHHMTNYKHNPKFLLWQNIENPQKTYHVMTYLSGGGRGTRRQTPITSFHAGCPRCRFPFKIFPVIVKAIICGTNDDLTTKVPMYCIQTHYLFSNYILQRFSLPSSTLHHTVRLDYANERINIAKWQLQEERATCTFRLLYN